ncbi:outer membrane beta-barrel protein [Dyadobacter sandarakinus]|uniref:Outer membrane beta-barrel protein n=1 Tax=Dyadobacter sandarakinus TaxID=2747268 RepID=A0ABX7IEN9_9BACT|nr:outer membrane beta-barrel protein [Dyadobacter sandarakinus]
MAGICFFTGHTPVSAQKIELGAGLGGLNYKGDISPSVRLRFFRPGGSLFFRYNPSQALSLRAEIMGGLITASDEHSKDPFQQARNMSFRSRVFEGSTVAEYNFLNYEDRRFAFNWTPYVFGGIGLMKFSPSPQTASYKTSSLVLPYGVGIKYQVKRPWNIGLELGARKTFSDYLDNLGGEPVNNDKLQQGDPSLKDSYLFLRLSVSYTFYKIVCP